MRPGLNDDFLFHSVRGTSVEKGAGDFWQLGGVLVVKPDGKIAYHFISDELGDHAPETDVMSYDDLK